MNLDHLRSSMHAHLPLLVAVWNSQTYGRVSRMEQLAIGSTVLQYPIHPLSTNKQLALQLLPYRYMFSAVLPPEIDACRYIGQRRTPGGIACHQPGDIGQRAMQLRLLRAGITSTRAGIKWRLSATIVLDSRSLVSLCPCLQVGSLDVTLYFNKLTLVQLVVLSVLFILYIWLARPLCEMHCIRQRAIPALSNNAGHQLCKISD